MFHCSAVVKELLARADKPGSAVFCFLVPLLFIHFFLFSLCFLTLFFLLTCFFFIFTADPADHALGSIYILNLSPEFRVLDLHTGQAYGQKTP